MQLVGPGPSRSRRSRRSLAGAVACLAFAAGAIATTLLFSRGTPPRVATFRQVDSRQVRLESPGADVSARARPGTPGSAALDRLAGGPGANRSVLVRVVEAEAGTPVADATVLVYRRTGIVSESGFVSEAEVVARGLTSDSGTVSLSLADGPDLPLRVRAWSAVHAPSEEELPNLAAGGAETAPEEIVLRVDRGGRISGVVRDLRGAPVPGLHVWAATVGVRFDDVGPDNMPVGAESASRTASDASGRFELQGVGDGIFQLGVKSPGWRVVRARASPDPARTVRQRIYARAGATNAELVVEPVRCFRLLLLHGATDAPVSDPYTRIHAQPHPAISPIRPEGDEMDETELRTSAGTTVRVFAQDAEPGVWVGAVGLRDAQSTLASCRVSIQAVGCEPCVAHVTLRHVDEIAGDRLADEVRLRPDLAFTSIGELLVSEPTPLRSEHPLWSYRVLELDWGEGMAVPVERACTTADRTWRFRRVPVGRRRIRIRNGASVTPWSDVDVRPDAPARLVASYLPATGFTLTAVTARGARLSDFALCGVTRLDGDDAGTGIRIYPSLLRPSLVEGGLAAPVVPLDPGAYRIDLLKPGFRAGSSRFEVLEGVVVALRLDLVPDDAFAR